MDRVVALILAGGASERLSILSAERAKPAVPFGGKYRIIDFTLSNCANSGICNVAVLTQFYPRSLVQHIGVGRPWDMDRTTSSVVLLQPFLSRSIRDWYKGTADAVYQNLAHFDKGMVEMVLVLAADHVYKLDYRRMLAFHQEVKADVTVGVISVPMEQAHRFGTVTVDTNGKVLDFVEKSPMPQSNLASMGIYVFNRNILTERLREDAGDPRSRHDFGYSILPRMVKQDRVFAYRFNGYWQDIGTIEAYYSANIELTKEPPTFSLNGTSSVLMQEQRLSPPYIGKQAIIKNSLVSPGCVIRGCVENSILSPGICVDEQAVVKNSVIMENTYIGYHSIVDRCVLDEEVNIGNYCYIGLSPNPTPSDSDVTVLGKGVTIPPHTAIGRGCKISPHVGPADFTTNVVLPGAVVSNGRQGDVFRYEERKYMRETEDARRKAHCHSG